MTIKVVQKIPEKEGRDRISRKALSKEMKRRLNSIMKTKAKYGQLIFDKDEYASIYSMRNSLQCSAKKYKYPLVFEFHNGDLYFTRTDLDDQNQEIFNIGDLLK